MPVPAILGEKIGRYTLLGKLAMGGMAEVFLAKQEGPEGFNKTVVIKRILPQLAADDTFVQMFLNEARLAANLNHPNVLSIYELGRDEETGAYFIAMEWIDGCNLKRLYKAASGQRRLPPFPLTARIAAEVCKGLDFAHNLKGSDNKPLGIVHRDISPENVLVSYAGMVKVVDFGIAKAAQNEGLTRTGQVKGKFAYMSPELLVGGACDRRADVWALGVTLYWMLSGRKPFAGDNEGQLVQKILNEEPQDLSTTAEVPPAYADVVARALRKNPDERYPTAAAMERELELLIAREDPPPPRLSDYLGELFPEDTDRDRMLIRAIVSGELRQQPTPSPTNIMAPTATVSRSVASFQPQRSLKFLTGAVTALLLICGTLALFIVKLATHTSTPSAVAEAHAQTPPLPAPTVAPPAVAPIPPLPLAAPEPKDEPKEAEGKPEAKPHHPREKHHEGVVARAPMRTPKPVAEAPAPVPPPEPHPNGSPGMLAVRVAPWAEVYLDGEHLGVTPFEAVSVPSGTHHLRLVNDEIHASKDMTVEVKAGETAVVKAKLQ